MEELSEIYYPLTKISEGKRDVALIELQNAQTLSNNQTKIYSQFANILIASSTLILSVFLNKDELNVKPFFESGNLLVFTVFLTFLGLLMLRYFVDLQKEITINARKVVILRTMLGLDYSSIQLTLPNNRIESATNPFNIKFFNGWFMFQSIPFWVILILVQFVWMFNFYSFDISNIYINKYYLIDNINIFWFFGSVSIFLLYSLIFRLSLNDKNENIYLYLSFFVSKLFNIKFLKDFEYSIYRSKLSFVELDRIDVDFSLMREILVRIEDRSFYKHSGLDFRALIRGFFSQFKFFRVKFGILRSGGSTLNMQLARTIFIPTEQSLFKRKILELFVAKWLNHVFSKDDLIKIYVSSVRYGYGTMGLAKAIKKYFGVEQIRGFSLSREQSFFLIERLSSVSHNVNYRRVNYLLDQCSDLSVNKEVVLGIYSDFESTRI